MIRYTVHQRSSKAGALSSLCFRGLICACFSSHHEHTPSCVVMLAIMPVPVLPVCALSPPPPAPTQPSCTNLPPPLVCRLCLLTLTWLCSMDACAHLRVIPARVLLPFGVCPSPRWRESLLSPPSPPPWGTPPFYFLQAMFVDFGMTVQYGGVCYLHLCCYLVPCASRFCPLPHK